MDSEWITAGLGTASLVVDDMFTAAGLPTPRWAIRCESIPGLIAITARSDLIATVPKSLLALGIADRLLEPIRVREKMASSTMSLFIKRDSPLNAAASRLVRLIKERGKASRAPYAIGLCRKRAGVILGLTATALRGFNSPARLRAAQTDGSALRFIASINGATMSIGSGKTMVEFLSAGDHRQRLQVAQLDRLRLPRQDLRGLRPASRRPAARPRRGSPWRAARARPRPGARSRGSWFR